MTELQKSLVSEAADLQWSEVIDQGYVQRVARPEGTGAAAEEVAAEYWTESGIEFLKSKGDKVYKKRGSPKPGQRITEHDKSYLEKEGLPFDEVLNKGYAQVKVKEEEVSAQGSDAGSAAGSDAEKAKDE